MSEVFANNKMNPEIKAKWLEALRSGKYQQQRSGLRNEAGFCCLGVLCDVIDPTKWVVDNTFYYVSYGESRTSFLPTDLLEEINLRGSEQTLLVQMNDRHKMSFEEIANHIENNL